MLDWFTFITSKMASVQELQSVACEAIDKHSTELQELNKKIWENPELNFEEFKSHGILTDFFEKHGLEVTRKWTLDTAFGAKYGGADGTCVGVLCEYDALPNVGHACGHNLIAEAGAAAALGIKAALEKSGNSLGRLQVLGTPAEEGGGGKIYMIKNGCFKDVDFSMMVHPCPHDALIGSRNLAISQHRITYKGYAAHAAAFPWEGINALDAAIMAYNSVSMMRQQMKPTWRVHGVITEGGVKPNIIPDKTVMEYYIRAPDRKEREELQTKVLPCFEAAAKATGCTVEIEESGLPYAELKTNLKLAELYTKHAEGMGISFMSKEAVAKLSMGSTDMGDVSYALPSIHPFYSIDTTAPNHSYAFTAAAATDTAHQKTIIAAKAMAMTAIEVMSDPDMLKVIKSQFKQSQ